MEFKEGLKTARKMCMSGSVDCHDCAFDGSCWLGLEPDKWSDAEIDKISELVEKWAEKHKPKTWLKVLLERLPNAELNNGVPSLCPFAFFGGNAPVKVGLECFGKCRECWNSIASDEFQDEEG